MASNNRQVSNFIAPLNMNGMRGRVLHLPARRRQNNSEILFIYDNLSSLENSWGLAQALSRFGTVTAPDLPGFGGMDSFYTTSERPSLENMADYLTSFIKMTYKGKRFKIVALPYGFLVATRTLKRHPEIKKRVELIVSIDGFAHFEDLALSPAKLARRRLVARLASFKLLSFLTQHLVINRRVVRQALVAIADNKVATAFFLNNCSDIRTFMATKHEMLSVDNCSQSVGVPFRLVMSPASTLDEFLVEQHLRVIFSDFRKFKTKVAYSASSIASEKEAAAIVPPGLKRELGKKSSS